MAYASTHVTVSNASGLVGRVQDMIAALRDSWNRSRVYTRTYNELSMLSTRELNDIGISRSMITRLAHEAAYGANA